MSVMRAYAHAPTTTATATPAGPLTSPRDRALRSTSTLSPRDAPGPGDLLRQDSARHSLGVLSGALPWGLGAQAFQDACSHLPPDRVETCLLSACDVAVSIMASLHRMERWSRRGAVAIGAEGTGEGGGSAGAAAGGGAGGEKGGLSGTAGGAGAGGGNANAGVTDGADAAVGVDEDEDGDAGGGEWRVSYGELLAVSGQELERAFVSGCLAQAAATVAGGRRMVWESLMRRVLSLLSAPAALDSLGFQGALRWTQGLEEVGAAFTGQRGGTLHAHLGLVHRQLFSAHHRHGMDVLRSLAQRETWHAVRLADAMGKAVVSLREVLGRAQPGSAVFGAWGRERGEEEGGRGGDGGSEGEG